MADRRFAALSRVLRSLGRDRGFTATVVLILGLGIGMSAAMFTVFEALLLRPLPAAQPERLVTLVGGGSGAAAGEVPLSPGQYDRYRAETAALSDVAAFAHWGSFAFAIRDGDRPLVLRQAAVTGNFFDVLGTRPVLGRMLEPADEREWGARDTNAGDYAMVLSHEAWRRVFGGDPAIIGQRLSTPVTNWDPVIVGVAPPGLDFPRGVDYWIAVRYGSMNLVGRLGDGASLEAAERDYQNFIDRDPAYALLGDRTLTARVDRLAEAVVGDVRPALLALTAAVGLLLLLACINIGNLLLVRAAGRTREVAIRRALGSGAARILRACLAESAVLALLGGALGAAFARLFLAALLRLAPDVLPRTDVIRQAGTPFMAAAAAAFLALLLFGLPSAFGALRVDLASPLRAGGRGGTERRSLRRLRETLVVVQIALALVVLAGAGLLLHSFTRLAGLDFGFPTEQLAFVAVAPPYDRFVQACGGAAPPSDSARSARFAACALEHVFALHDRIEERLSVLPDVAGVSTLLIPPFLGPSVFMTKVAAEGQDEDAAGGNPWFGFEAVGPDFFRTLELPLLRGRAFTPADHGDAPDVAVVTEGVARALWPGEDAVGRRFHGLGLDDPDSLVTVVGVVPDVHYREHRTPTPTIYRPYRQAMAQASFIVRTRGTLSAALPGLESALREVDGALVVTRAETMDQLVEPQLAAPRLQALLLSAFALAALVIAAIGLYGTMAQTVARRTRELGVRMALGATAGHLRAMVLRRAARIAGIGALVGLAGAIAASRLIASLLFRVSPVDPLTLGGVSALLLGVALAAAFVPARRATCADPLDALRAE